MQTAGNSLVLNDTSFHKIFWWIIYVSEQFGGNGAYVTAKVQNHLLSTLIFLQQLLPTPQKKKGWLLATFFHAPTSRVPLVSGGKWNSVLKLSISKASFWYAPALIFTTLCTKVSATDWNVIKTYHICLIAFQ